MDFGVMEFRFLSLLSYDHPDRSSFEYFADLSHLSPRERLEFYDISYEIICPTSDGTDDFVLVPY